MEEIYLAVDSSPSRPLENDQLSSGSPQPRYPEPPPGPATRGEKIWASPSLSPSTGPEGIKSSTQSEAPLESPSAPGPGSGVVASARVDSLLEPGPCGGPCLENAIRRSSPAQRD